MSTERDDRWASAQLKEDAFWQREDVFDDQMQRVIYRYGPVIRDISERIDSDAAILDVGCGPTCAAALFSAGLKLFIDPLMSSYQKSYPGTLPESGKISGTGEYIPLKGDSVDIVTCFNALDHMIEPGAVLDEIRRVLKPGGIFVLGIFLHPTPIAVLRRFIDKWIPIFREDAHPYSYTLNSMTDLLGRYFSIKKETRVYRKDSALIPSIHREDWVFTCAKD